MNKKKAKMASAVLVIVVVMGALPAYAQLIPHGISGIVYMSDSVTEAPWGTSFSVNDTTSGDYIAGTTGAGPHGGGYSVTINGTDGDTVIIRAWNVTHYGETTVILAGDMAGIDVIINKTGADITPPASVSNLDEIDKGTTWILWDWTNPPDPDFNHTRVYIDGVFEANVYAPAHIYNATGLSPNTIYEIGTRTVDDSGNINATWVNDTATTLSVGPTALRVNVMPEYYTFNGTSNIIWGNCHWDPADTVHTGTYNWTFGDGTWTTGTVSDTAGWGHARYIPVTHAYTSEGVYYATLTVTADFDGSSDNDTVKINVYNASTLTAEQLEKIKVNKAIEDGLRCLYNLQYTDGKWGGYGSYWTSGTGEAVLAFENQGHIPLKDINKDIYAEYVQMGLDYLFGQLSVQTLSNQTYIGNPDTNGNGIGLYWYGEGRPVYSTPMAMMAIIGSLTPDATATTGDATYVNGRTYLNITRDICDYLAWAQNEAGGGVYRGGWRYTANYGDSDNSVSQWPALGLLAAEKRWSITAPVYELVKDELERWVNYSQNSAGGSDHGGFGYESPTNWVNIAKTGAGLIMLSYIDADTSDSRVINATIYLNNTWDVNNNDPGWRIKPYGAGSFYAMYAVYKGCLDAEPSPIVYLPLPAGSRNWYADFVDYLLNTQTTDGCWPAGLYGDINLDTMWAILILSPTVIGGPVADAGPDQYVSVHEPVTFDGSASYHTAGLNITQYLWDFDASNGVDWNNPDASGEIVTYRAGYPAPGNYTVTLRVKDELTNTDTDTTMVNVTAKPIPAAVPTLTPVGIIALAGLLAVIAVGRIRRKR